MSVWVDSSRWPMTAIGPGPVVVPASAKAMGWTPPHLNGIEVPDWKCHPRVNRENSIKRADANEVRASPLISRGYRQRLQYQPLLDPLHLIRIERRLGKVHQCEVPGIGLNAVRHAHRHVDDHARLERDGRVPVHHRPATADNVEHV